MASPYELVHRHVAALLDEAGKESVAPETVASNLITEALKIMQQSRSNADIVSEVTFMLENLEERDYEFMRP